LEIGNQAQVDQNQGALFQNFINLPDFVSD